MRKLLGTFLLMPPNRLRSAPGYKAVGNRTGTFCETDDWRERVGKPASSVWNERLR